MWFPFKGPNNIFCRGDLLNFQGSRHPDLKPKTPLKTNILHLKNPGLEDDFLLKGMIVLGLMLVLGSVRNDFKEIHKHVGQLIIYGHLEVPWFLDVSSTHRQLRFVRFGCIICGVCCQHVTIAGKNWWFSIPIGASRLDPTAGHFEGMSFTWYFVDAPSPFENRKKKSTKSVRHRQMASVVSRATSKYGSIEGPLALQEQPGNFSSFFPSFVGGRTLTFLSWPLWLV